jgi:hypothetical protein
LVAAVEGSQRQQGRIQEPPADRFVGQIQTTLGEHLFDIAQAERESSVEPDRVSNDRWREAVAFEAEWRHAPS